MATDNMTAHIQARDTSGNWRTYSTTINGGQYVLLAMKSLQAIYPNFRIRAVDDAGRVIDYL